MPYTLPQEELVKLFSQNCLRPIASILQIQRYNTLEEVIAQVVIIEKVKIEYGEIKIMRKERYNKNEYCNYHHQRGHSTKNCLAFRNRTQNSIKDNNLEVEDHTSILDQNLKNYQDSLPSYQVNIVSIVPNYSQVTPTWNPSNQPIIKIVGVDTGTQNIQEKQIDISYNQKSKM